MYRPGGRTNHSDGVMMPSSFCMRWTDVLVMVSFLDRNSKAIEFSHSRRERLNEYSENFSTIVGQEVVWRNDEGVDVVQRTGKREAGFSTCYAERHGTIEKEEFRRLCRR